jgi:hypothetical protein
MPRSRPELSLNLDNRGHVEICQVEYLSFNSNLALPSSSLLAISLRQLSNVSAVACTRRKHPVSELKVCVILQYDGIWFRIYNLTVDGATIAIHSFVTPIALAISPSSL